MKFCTMLGNVLILFGFILALDLLPLMNSTPEALWMREFWYLFCISGLFIGMLGYVIDNLKKQDRMIYQERKKQFRPRYPISDMIEAMKPPTKSCAYCRTIYQDSEQKCNVCGAPRRALD